MSGASREPSSEETTDAESPRVELPRRRARPPYIVEIEGHGVLAAFDKFGPGLGAGGRLAIPVVNGPLRMRNDLAVGIGFDWVRYGAYEPRTVGRTVVTQAFYVPVFVQWNLWPSNSVSIFLEPTLLYRFASYSGPCGGCADTDRVLPSASIGMRFRLNRFLAGTFRVGWPMVTLGASWL